MAAATLSDAERRLLAAKGGWEIARALGTCDGLPGMFTSNGTGSLDPTAERVRPDWKGGWYAVRPGRIELHMGGEIVVKLSRRRLESFIADLPAEVREEIALHWRDDSTGYRDRLVWSALGLTYPDDGSSETATVPGVSDYAPNETIAMADKVAELRAAWSAGQPLSGGQLFGLPALNGDVWVDTAGATVITGLPAKTITSYLSRGKPRSNPFPAASKFLGRNYWPATPLLDWAAEQGETGGQ